jgi:hypothetical protein
VGLAKVAAIVLWAGFAIGGWEERITAHYGRTAMDTVLENRQTDYEQGRGPFIPRASCYIAHPTIPLGSWVQVRGRNTGKVRRCVVADVSAPEDRARHIGTKLIEIDWANTLTICGSRALPNRKCPSLVRRLR